MSDDRLDDLYRAYGYALLGIFIGVALGVVFGIFILVMEILYGS